MTRSIADAVQSDGSLVTATAVEEDLAREDRAMAHRLNGVVVNFARSATKQNIGNLVLSKLAGMFVSEDAGHQVYEHHDEGLNNSSEPSGIYGGTRKDDRRLTRDCEACKEERKYFDLISGSCGHEYCRECLRELFEASLTDESLFPPRFCRQPITVDAVSIFLTRDLTRRFEEKKSS